MSLKLGDMLTAIRGLHPAFDQTRVPNVVLASFLSDYQNRLIALGVQREKTFLSQSVAVAVNGAAGAPEGGAFVQLTNGVPFTTQLSGYYVLLDANGVPYINPAVPIVAVVDQGVTLPMLLAVIGGTVRYLDGGLDEKLCITSYGQRFHPEHFPAVYFVDQALHLCGTAADWAEVGTIELRYTPLAPRFASLGDYFLLPDGAAPAVIANGAAYAAQRVQAFAQSGQNPVPDVSLFKAEALQAQNEYLSTFRLTKRARTTTMREEHY